MTNVAAFEALLSCLRTGPDGDGSIRPELIPASVWDEMTEIAISQRIGPLLYYRLHRAGTADAIPADIVHRLRVDYLRNSSVNLIRYYELTETLKALNEHRIPIILLKGAYLAEFVYGNIALRPMSDIDIMVKAADYLGVVRMMLGIGYQMQKGRNIEDLCRSQGNHIVLFKSDRSVIEVHWTFSPNTVPPKVGIEEMWERTQKVSLAGLDVLVLSPEDLLLHLCIHASFQHAFSFGLLGLYDIVEVIRTCPNGIDWEQLKARSKRWETGRGVYLSLYFAKELLGAAVPGEVLNALRPDDLGSQVLGWTKCQILADRSASLLRFRIIVRLGGGTPLQEKASILLKAFFPAREVLRKMYHLPLGSSRLYWYYPVRLKDVFFRYSPAAWRLLRREKKMAALSEQMDSRANLIDWMRHRPDS